ncbi:unnamed protein product, partial [Rotaria sp. Silwood2]
MEALSLKILAKETIKSLLKFGGARNEDVVTWLHDAEEVFDRAQLRSSNKYIAVQYYLTHTAEKWFRLNKSSIPDWSTFKREIIKAFQPTCHQTFLKMKQRLQLPHESVMEYYSDKIQLCLQADSNMSASIIIHDLITGLTQSLIPHVIRRHPSTPADFLAIAQDEEHIQFTLNDLSRASINPPDNYPNNNDPIDPSVMVVTQHINADKRPPHCQQPSLFSPSRVHDQHQFTFNKKLQEIKPEQVILQIPISNSTISQKGV